MSSEPEDGDELHRCDVLLLGASMAGVEVLLQLQRRSSRTLKIVVVDRQPRHGYIPLAHERLCDRLPPPDELDTEAFARSWPEVEFWTDEVLSLDPEQRVAELESGRRVSGRFVVVALGSELAPPPSLPGSEHLLRYKLAEPLEHTRERVRGILGPEREGSETPHLVVVGGGISGVELAGDLAHLRRQRPEGWAVPEVTLVSGSSELLPELAPGVRRRAAAILREQGVELRLGTHLVRAEEDAVVLDSGPEPLPCAAAFWAAGIRPAPVLADLGLPLTDDGWLKVGPTLQCLPTPVPRNPDVFACGDAVRVYGGTGRWPTMQRAIECLWQAKVVARNIATLAACRPDYPDGLPSLRPHVLRERFFYGVSLGGRSLVVYGGLALDVPVFGIWFRRWLMRQYFARYAPRS